MPTEDKDSGCKVVTIIKHPVAGDDQDYGATYLLLTAILLYFF